jgi:hypothetical protein
MNSQTLRAGGFLGPEFNLFLFASIGEDQRGGPLSVASALGRLDLDAWAEAAALARLPQTAAVAKLASWISRFTEFPLIVRDAQATARRLVALLPDSAPASPIQPGQAAAKTPGLARPAWLLLLVTCLWLGMLALGPASHAPAPTQVPTTQAARP